MQEQGWDSRLGGEGQGRMETNSSSPSRLRPALGECLARLAAAMPVAFLEPELNEYNACSVYTTKSPRERASESRGLGQLSGARESRPQGGVLPKSGL